MRSIGSFAYFCICSLGTNSRLLIAASIIWSILKSSLSSLRNTWTATSALDIHYRVSCFMLLRYVSSWKLGFFGWSLYGRKSLPSRYMPKPYTNLSVS